MVKRSPKANGDVLAEKVLVSMSVGRERPQHSGSGNRAGRGSAPFDPLPAPVDRRHRPEIAGAKADADGDGGRQEIEGLRDHHPGQ